MKLPPSIVDPPRLSLYGTKKYSVKAQTRQRHMHVQAPPIFHFTLCPLFISVVFCNCDGLLLLMFLLQVSTLLVERDKNTSMPDGSIELALLKSSATSVTHPA